MADQDALQQRITLLLQEIDGNVCSSHRCATRILSKVRRNHHLIKKIHDSMDLWTPFFDRLSIPQSTSANHCNADVNSRSALSNTIDMQEESALNAFQSTTKILTPRVNGGEMQHREPLVPSFKTCSLQEYAAPSSQKSADISVDSEKLPPMTRTPYLRRSSLFGINRNCDTHEEQKRTPNMSSPPRTGALKKICISDRQINEQQTTGYWDTSSVKAHDESVYVSKNLMKMGAFEMSPNPVSSYKTNTETIERGQDVILQTPEIPIFTTVSPAATLEPVQSPGRDERFNRSLKSPQNSDIIATPIESSKKNKIPLYAQTPTQSKLGSDDLLTPTLTSPLVSTKLKCMTPHTPLSNRLVGASLDVGTKSQESALLEYEEYFTNSNPPPAFDLSLFPSAFQQGSTAVAISALYSRFHGNHVDGRACALSVKQLEEHFPDYGKQKIEILLDVLVSQRLLRPFVVDEQLFWQIPLHKEI